jgi:hypothetical protein
MDASQTIPTRTARFAALIAIGRIVPIMVAAPPVFPLEKSERQAHPVGLTDVHPAYCAAERFDARKVATWHGNCVPVLGIANEDPTANSGSGRRRDRVQIRSATQSQGSREMRVAK